MKTIQLTRDKAAIVDDADYDLLSLFKWSARKIRHVWYASSKTQGYMHRFIMGLSAGQTMKIDHRDGDGLNNKRSNLRICTNQQNVWKNFRRLPPSGFRGVRLQRGRWQANIRMNGRDRYIGNFATKVEAARAYDAAVTRLRGEWAVTNVMLGAYDKFYHNSPLQKDARETARATGFEPATSGVTGQCSNQLS